jgi:hypothetical protein
MNDHNEIYLKVEACQGLISQTTWLLDYLTQSVEDLFDVDSLIEQLQQFLGIVEETLEELLCADVTSSEGDQIPYSNI